MWHNIIVTPHYTHIPVHMVLQSKQLLYVNIVWTFHTTRYAQGTRWKVTNIFIDYRCKWPKTAIANVNINLHWFPRSERCTPTPIMYSHNASQGTNGNKYYYEVNVVDMETLKYIYIWFSGKCVGGDTIFMFDVKQMVASCNAIFSKQYSWILFRFCSYRWCRFAAVLA